MRRYFRHILLCARRFEGECENRDMTVEAAAALDCVRRNPGALRHACVCLGFMFLQRSCRLSSDAHELRSGLPRFRLRQSVLCARFSVQLRKSRRVYVPYTCVTRCNRYVHCETAGWAAAWSSRQSCQAARCVLAAKLLAGPCSVFVNVCLILQLYRTILLLVKLHI